MSDVLPPGWIFAEIGELCDLVNGKAFKKTDWSNKGLPIIRIQNLNNKDALFNCFNGEIDEKFKIDNGQLLFAWSGTPGTSFGAHIWKGRKAVLNQHIYKVVFDERYIDKDFFRYAINQKLEEVISKAQGGVGLRHITKTKFQKTKISFPPYNEQKRIAEKLEQLLTAVEATKNRLDKVPTILKRFRQSVLAAAVSGELTKDWREGNDISSWKKLSLAEIIKGKPRNGYSPRAVSYKTDIKSLTLTATTSGVFNPIHFKYIDTKISDDSHLWLEDGDILIQRGNTLEYVGVSAIYRGSKKTFIYPDLMMKVKAQDNILVGYLHYSLLSEPVREYFRNNATGTAGNMPKINQSVVMSAPISVPPLEEQQEIISRVDALFALADQILEKQKNALLKTTKLRSSILAKAFRGEIVPQDPNDEPADKLLERIKKLPVIPPRKRRSSKKATVSTQRTAMIVTSISNLKELIAVLGSEEMTADRLIVKSGLSENEKSVDLFYELLREGRDAKKLDVPVGQNLPIRLIHNANR